MIANVQSLIGYFELDPNRVLDLVLETLEAVPSCAGSRELVSLFNPNYIPHILGFKFQYYQGANGGKVPAHHLSPLFSALSSASSSRLLPPSHAFSPLPPRLLPPSPLSCVLYLSSS